MNLNKLFEYRHSLSTEDLLNEISEKLELDANNNQFFKTIGMIMVAHSGDNRRKHDSCLNHILRVTLHVADLSRNNMSLMTLALLHDVVEDYPEYIAGTTDNLWRHVEQEYGKEITKSLIVLTNPPEVEKEEKEVHHNPINYHQHIEKVLKNKNAAIIKTIDFCDNLMTVATSENRGFREQLKRRYFPVMNLFLDSAADNSLISQSDIEQYFAFIKERF